MWWKRKSFEKLYCTIHTKAQLEPNPRGPFLICVISLWTGQPSFFYFVLSIFSRYLFQVSWQINRKHYFTPNPFCVRKTQLYALMKTSFQTLFSYIFKVKLSFQVFFFFFHHPSLNPPGIRKCMLGTPLNTRKPFQWIIKMAKTIVQCYADWWSIGTPQDQMALFPFLWVLCLRQI